MAKSSTSKNARSRGTVPTRTAAARKAAPGKVRSGTVTSGTVTRTRAVAARSKVEATADTPEGTRAAAKKTSAPKLPKAVAGAVAAARDKKAEDIVVLDLRKADGFTDYFVICTGANARQITAIADAVRETLKQEFDERPALAEGANKSEWVLVDYFNFVVHIFSRECRAFYGLERLWGNAERHEFPEVAPVRT
jgi:ribosome-associated protein